MKILASLFTLVAASNAMALSLNCTLTNAQTKANMIEPKSLALAGDLVKTDLVSVDGTKFQVSVTGKQVELTAVTGTPPFNFSTVSSSSKKKARLNAYVGQTLVQFDCELAK